LIRTRAAAALLGLHPDTLRRAATEGTIPSVRLGERGWLRLRITDIEKLAGRRVRDERAASLDPADGTRRGLPLFALRQVPAGEHGGGPAWARAKLMLVGRAEQIAVELREVVPVRSLANRVAIDVCAMNICELERPLSSRRRRRASSSAPGTAWR
jgi:excisionase family DNA binding protein